MWGDGGRKKSYAEPHFAAQIDPESLVIVPGMVGSRELTVWVVFVFAFIS